MRKKMILDDIYCAEQAHEEAPWLIRNGESRVIGHYSIGLGVNWGALMANDDKEWLAGLMEQKVGEQRPSSKEPVIVVSADQRAVS